MSAAEELKLHTIKSSDDQTFLLTDKELRISMMLRPFAEANGNRVDTVRPFCIAHTS